MSEAAEPTPFKEPKSVELFRPRSLNTPGALQKVAEYWVAEYGGEGVNFTKEQESLLASLIHEGREAEEQKVSSTARPTRETLRELNQKITAGKRAQEALVETNLRFAFMFARESVGIKHEGTLQRFREGAARYSQQNPGEYGKGQRRYGNESRGYLGAYAPLHSLKSPYASLEDRYSYAALGLMTAAKHFDPAAPDPKTGLPRPIEKRPSFVSFAAWNIHGQMDRQIKEEENNGIRLPVNAHKIILDYFKEHPTEQPNEVVPQNVARLLAMTEPATFPELNVEASYEDDVDEDVPIDFTEVYPDVEREELETLVTDHLLGDQFKSLLDALPEREATIIRMRFGIDGDGRPKTLDEIAEVVEVSRERIRQIESKTLAKLRHPSRSTDFRGYMDSSESPLETVQSGDVVKEGLVRTAYFGINLYERDLHNVAPRLTPEQQKVRLEQNSWRPQDETWAWAERSGPVAQSEEYVDPELFQFLYKFIDAADSEYFSKSFTEKSKTPYPTTLIEQLNGFQDGKLLNAGHIASVWDRFIRHGYVRIKTELGTDFSPNRVGQFFSRLIANNFISPEANTDILTLRIPTTENGQIGYLATGLRYGRIHIVGNTGNYTGAYNRGFAEVTVDGNVEYGAGMGMREDSTLTINGYAGRDLGFNALGNAFIEAKECISIGRSGDREAHVDAKEATA